MKKIIIPLVFLITLQVAIAENLVITQVLYDPAAETGSEAVEIYNPTAAAVDISGWQISTETSASDATIPSGTILQPSQYYLIADAGWSISRDDLSWPIANHEEALTLGNTDAGVALSDATNIIDAVGWGNSLNIQAGLFEGTPAAAVSPGMALKRVGDTNDNSADFIAASPLFHSNMQQSGEEISIIAVVYGGAPVIGNISISPDDDSTLTGTQISPVPKANKTIAIRASISAIGGEDQISVNATVMSKTYAMKRVNGSIYEALVNMSYANAAGNYTAVVTAADNLGSSSSSAQFEYMSLVAMEIDTEVLRFGASPGQFSEVAGDTSTNTNNATIWNIGNSQIDLQLWATNLTAASSVIDIGNLEYSLTGTYGEKMTNNPVIKDVNINSAEKKPLSFRLKIPTTAKPGNYTGSIQITAVKG